MEKNKTSARAAATKAPTKKAAARRKARPTTTATSAKPARKTSAAKAAVSKSAVNARPASRSKTKPEAKAAQSQASAEQSAARLSAATLHTASATHTPHDRHGDSHLAEHASEHTLAINPLIGISKGLVVGAAKNLFKVLLSSPKQSTEKYLQYLKELAAVAQGKSELAPDPKDRRFLDPAWKTNPLYKRLLQVYLATQKDLTKVIQTSDLDTMEKGQAQFFAALVTDAMAPSNWLLGNPAAVRKILDTGGDNLVKGFRNMLHDMKHNNMMPSMVDASGFKVGENIATSPGQVVFRHPMFELIQYAPTTPQVHQRPLVMSPPQVNKFYAIDLTPDKSLVKWTVDSGIQMFVISWRNPTVEQRDWGLEHYVQALDAAVDVAREITGSPDVNMWGSCSGGMTLAAYLGWLAARGDKKVANTSWAVCVLNTQAALEDSTLGLFNSPATIHAAKARSQRKGIVDGSAMAAMFAWLRPNDLIWNYWVNNYLLGNQPPAYDVLAWNADTTRLPGQYHCDLLDMIEKNPFMNPGALEIGGVPIDFSQVSLGAYVVAGITDHITPWRACYGTARLFGSATTFVLANAGHLQSMVNPPGGTKSYFFSGEATQEDPMDWAQQHQSTKQEGSWWPHWRSWMQQRSGKLQDAPQAAGSRKHKPLEKAPGTYVLET